MVTQNPKVIRINGNVNFNILQTNKRNWIAVCEPLKLTFQADTWANLMEDIAHTLDAILKDLLSSNELDKFLKDKGWNVIGRIPAKQSPDMFFDLPFLPVMAKANDTARSVH